MQSQSSFFEEIIEKVGNIRGKEFLFHGVPIEEKNVEKRLCAENTLEVRNLKSSLRKKAIELSKRPGNVNKKVYETTNPQFDIFDENLFRLDNESEESSSFDFHSLPFEDKMKHITDYMHLKSIYLNPIDMEKVENIVKDESISLKKYITTSKMYQNIQKISFIKKNETGMYYFAFDDLQPKRVKKNFFK